MASGVGALDAHDNDEILATGTMIAGRYEIKKHLAAGGMGRVYVATQAPLGRRVALKVMHRELCQDTESVKRFFREAVAVSQLQHPNTITVFDYGESADGNFYIAMEFLEGEPLGDRIEREGRLEVKDAVNITIQVARSLSEAHRKRIIHRDLKPDNVFLGTVEKDLVKVLDFGIAKILQEENDGGTKLTRMGFVCGTPEYMSPEQARGEDLDGRCDLYALGVMLYECLTGEAPFIETTPLATVLKHQNDPVPPMPSYVPPTLARFVTERAMAKEREDRPASAEDFVAELESAAAASGLEFESTGNMSSPPMISSSQESYGDTARDIPVTKKKRAVLFVAGILILAVVIGLSIVAIVGGNSTDSAEAAPATADDAKPENETPPEPAPAEAAAPEASEPGELSVALSFESEIDGVQIIDEAGTVLGETPFKLPVASNREREFTFRKAGYPDAIETLTTPDGVEGENVVETIDVVLASYPAVAVTSAPEGALVFVGEATESAGVTPLELELVPDAAVELRFVLEGHEVLSQSFTPKEGPLEVALVAEKKSSRRKKSGTTGTKPKSDGAKKSGGSGDKTKDAKKTDGKKKKDGDAKKDEKKGKYDVFN